MNTQVQDPHPPQTPEYIDDNLFTAVKDEVKHEISHIQSNKEPVDPTQSDVLVQKHFPGIFVILLSIVLAVLVLAIGGLWLYSRAHQ